MFIPMPCFKSPAMLTAGAFVVLALTHPVPAQLLNGAISGEFDIAYGASTLYYELPGVHREGNLDFTPLPIAEAAGRFTDLLQVPFTNPHIPADALPLIRAAVGADATQFQM